MTHFTPQQIFANLTWECKPDAKKQMKVMDYINEHLEEIKQAINESLEWGIDEFNLVEETKL